MIQIALGLILMIAGLLMRSLAVSQIKNFTSAIETPKHVEVTGIYGQMRHPAYTGSILFFVGMALVEIHAALIYFVSVFYLSRAIQEEALMPDSYKKYAAKTGRFLPKLKWGR